MKRTTNTNEARRLATLALLALALIPAACGGDRDEEDRPVSAPPRVSTEGGETIVTFDPGTLARSGLVVEALKATSHQAEATAYGSVLDLTELANARGAMTAAAQRVAKARAVLTASHAELERVQALYADDRNASQKTLQAATAAARADEAEARAAQAGLTALTSSAGQRWGVVIAGWLEHGSPDLEALLGQKERLVQLTLPVGASLASPPANATVRVGKGVAGELSLISPAPRTDPQIQGVSYFYAAPAAPSLLPGTTVEGTLPMGVPSAGVDVPASAVVWWKGQAWVYIEEGSGKFVRRQVPTDAPLPDGWFVATGLAPGERLVVRGAQLVLSEEGRGAVHGSEG